MPLAPPTTLFATPITSILVPPTITTTSLPGARVGSSYSATLTATGGVPPFTWRVNDGTLPTGLTLSSAGVISGVPSQIGNFAFTIICTDFIQQTASVSMQMAN